MARRHDTGKLTLRPQTAIWTVLLSTNIPAFHLNNDYRWKALRRLFSLWINCVACTPVMLMTLRRPKLLMLCVREQCCHKPRICSLTKHGCGLCNNNMKSPGLPWHNCLKLWLKIWSTNIGLITGGIFLSFILLATVGQNFKIKKSTCNHVTFQHKSMEITNQIHMIILCYYFTKMSVTNGHNTLLQRDKYDKH